MRGSNQVQTKFMESASGTGDKPPVGDKATVTDDANKLSKKQRGRLKKLRKRALEEKEGCESTGISSLSDWKELQELDSAGTCIVNVGPAIRPRRQSHYGSCQEVEGVDHRDIIYQVLHRTNVSKKRANNEISANVPAWATLHNINCVQSLAVVEIQVDEIDCSFDELLSRMPVLSQLKESQDKNVCSALPIPTKWFQGDQPKSMTESLLYFNPSPASARKKRKGSIDSASAVRAVDLLNSLTLTESQREKEGYPMILTTPANEKRIIPLQRPPSSLPTFEEAKWVVKGFHVSIRHQQEDDTIKASHVATKEVLEGIARVYALDCEMVKTSAGSELGRITLVQLDNMEPMMHTVVLDELVKPDRPILDYVTQFSGITAKMLNPVETRLEQIQAYIIQLLNSNDVLVGHSLENDLQAIRLVHDRVVDTSTLFLGKNGRKYALRHLTASLLKRTIQSEDGGHCSEEDAVASLELAVRRAIEGPSFRIYEASDSRVNLLEYLLHEREKPIVCIGPSEWLTTHVTPFSSSAHALTCETVEDDNRKALAAWLVNGKRRAKLVWANLVANKKTSLDTINNAVSDLIQSAMPETLILIALQSGHSAAKGCTGLRKARKNPRASLGWNDSDEQKWKDTSGKAKHGYSFWVGTK